LNIPTEIPPVFSLNWNFRGIKEFLWSPTEFKFTFIHISSYSSIPCCLQYRWAK
jgi:hypothetical protein